MPIQQARWRSAPQYEHAVERLTVTRAVHLSAPGATLLVAPSGYGKSVAAAQVARDPRYDASLWVDCSSMDATDNQSFLQGVVHALIGDSEQERVPMNPLMPTGLAIEPELALAELLRGFGSARLCIVLDALPDQMATVALESMMRQLDALPDCTFTLLGTTRRYDRLAPALSSVHVLGLEFLRMSSDEAVALVRSVAGDDVGASSVDAIVAVSVGQPALLCLLARHAAAGSLDCVLSGKSTIDLEALLYTSADRQLSPDDRQVLYAASLLRLGSIADLDSVCACDVRSALRHIAECIPLIHATGEGLDLSFMVHELAANVFVEAEWAQSRVEASRDLRERVMERLDLVGRHDRLFEVALAVQPDTANLMDWVTRAGPALLESGHLSLLAAALDALGPLAAIQHPKVLLLHSRVLREQHSYEAALRKAQVAYSLASHEGVAELEDEALLMIARLELDMGLIGDAGRSLSRYLSAVSVGRTEDSMILARAYLAACCAYTGEYRESREHIRAATDSITPAVSVEVRARVAICSAATAGLVGGRWDAVMDQLQSLADDASLSLGTRLQVKGNLGTVLCEVGRNERAGELLIQTVEECQHHGFTMLERAFLGSLASVEACRGAYSRANELVGIALAGHQESGDVLEFGHTLAYQSAWLRAEGSVGPSLLCAERVLEAAAVSECEWLSWAGLLEVSAGYLAENDTGRAALQAEAVLQAARDAGANFYEFCADMQLAEVARRSNDSRGAIERVLRNRDYLMTGSANWQLVMYIRAFPRLLAVLAAAVDPYELPVSLLRGLAAVDGDRLLMECEGQVAEGVLEALRLRLGTREATDGQIQTGLSRTCVRVFGGLSVRTPHGLVQTSAWKKSKARTLFLMLVLANGREIPRDQILDYLWPEMDEERARNNFYVVWSAMKLALMPGVDKSTPCAYAENTRGVCKINTALVQSDFARFEQLVTQLGRSLNTNERIALCEEIAEVYTGELLPGDIYEDWFAQLRDKCRIDFADAMLTVSRLLQDRGDIPRALAMARRGLAEDPCREDLGQVALQLQIDSGQRSAAIDTFMGIKQRLCDDLGLDPSAETVKLYEKVLAMEEMSEYITEPDDDAAVDCGDGAVP